MQHADDNYGEWHYKFAVSPQSVTHHRLLDLTWLREKKEGHKNCVELKPADSLCISIKTPIPGYIGAAHIFLN